jgi:hypothetical protein
MLLFSWNNSLKILKLQRPITVPIFGVTDAEILVKQTRDRHEPSPRHGQGADEDGHPEPRTDLQTPGTD